MGTGDELVLVAVEPGKRRLHGGERLRFAVRAAELADLAALGRIEVGERRIEVVDPARVDDRRLNNVLHALAAADPAPSLAEWLRATPRSLVYEYLSRLEDRKLLRVRRWRDRGGRSHHDILSVDAARRREVLARLDPADDGTGDGDTVLATLVQAAGLAHVAHPGLRGRAARRRLAARTQAAPLVSATGDLVRAGDEEFAAIAARGLDALSNRLFAELSDVYSDFGSGGHGLGHDLNAGSWSSGDPGGHHSGGGHSGGGHHGGGDGHGGW